MFVFKDINKTSSVITNNLVHYTHNLSASAGGISSIKVTSGSKNNNYWSSLNVLFYTSGSPVYGDKDKFAKPSSNLSLNNKTKAQYLNKFHGYASSSVISIPQQYYGEGVKVGSLQVEYGSITITDDSNSNLIDSASNIKGNIFYDRGLVVLTDGITDSSTLTNFDISYRSTMTIYENEIFLSVNENEFNVSQNPTAVYEVGGTKENISITKPNSRLVDQQYVSQSIYKSGAKYIRNKDNPIISSIDGVSGGSFDDYEISGSSDQTGSYLAPFITTIGLYDDENNMVASAKLPKPIKSLPDYPVNFIVRFDT